MKVSWAKGILLLAGGCFLLVLAGFYLGSEKSDNRGIAPVGSRDSRTAVVVLSYHQFDDTDSRYSLSLENLESHIRFFQNAGYQFITDRELGDWFKRGREIPVQAVLLTFDDGNESDYLAVFPLLRRLKVKGVFFPVVGMIDAPGRIKESQIREMVASGICSFGSHGFRHDKMILAPSEKIIDEIHRSRIILERITGEPLLSVAYPFGFWNDEIKTILEEEEIDFGFTVLAGVNTTDTDRLELRRIAVTSATTLNDLRQLMDRNNPFYRQYYKSMLQKNLWPGLESIAGACGRELARLDFRHN